MLNSKAADYEADLRIFEQYCQTMADYEEAQTLLLEGKTEEAVALLDTIGRAYREAQDYASENVETQKHLLDLQRQNAQKEVELLEEMMKSADESTAKIYQRQLESAKDYLVKCEKEYEKVAEKIPDTMAEAFEEKSFSVSQRIQKAMDSTVAGYNFSIFQTFGKNVAAGIAKGIDEGSSTVLDSSSTLIKRLTLHTKKEAMIKSPSRLFAKEVGAYIPSGIAMGIEDNQEDAIGSVENMVDLMASTGHSKSGNIVANTNISTDSSLVVEKLNQLIAVMTQQRIYLNGDVLVGELAPAMNTELGNISALTERGQ